MEHLNIHANEKKCSSKKPVRQKLTNIPKKIRLKDDSVLALAYLQFREQKRRHPLPPPLLYEEPFIEIDYDNCYFEGNEIPRRG